MPSWISVYFISTFYHLLFLPILYLVILTYYLPTLSSTTTTTASSSSPLASWKGLFVQALPVDSLCGSESLSFPQNLKGELFFFGFQYFFFFLARSSPCLTGAFRVPLPRMTSGLKLGVNHTTHTQVVVIHTYRQVRALVCMYDHDVSLFCYLSWSIGDFFLAKTSYNVGFNLKSVTHLVSAICERISCLASV